MDWMKTAGLGLYGLLVMMIVAGGFAVATSGSRAPDGFRVAAAAPQAPKAGPEIRWAAHGAGFLASR